VAGNARAAGHPLLVDSTKVSVTSDNNVTRKLTEKGRVSNHIFVWKKATRVQRTQGCLVQYSILLYSTQQAMREEGRQDGCQQGVLKAM